LRETLFRADYVDDALLLAIQAEAGYAELFAIGF
jgi:hypothetical protein